MADDKDEDKKTKPFGSPFNIHKQNKDKIEAALAEAQKKEKKKKKAKKLSLLNKKQKPKKKKTTVYVDGNSFTQHGPGKKKTY